MKTLSYTEIEANRKRWKPQIMTGTPIEAEEFTEAIYKAIALGLKLEIPVGEWVGEATKKELRIHREAKTTLGRNISDEAVHERGFKLANEAYKVGEKYHTDAAIIADRWLTFDKVHPLEKAATAEVGVFLCSLFPLAMFGGQDLSNLSAEIIRDEQRHIAVNWGILADIGVNRLEPNAEMNRLRLDTLDYIFDGVMFDDLGLDKDFFIDQSNQLLLYGYASELAVLSDHSIYNPPFEVSNSHLY